MRSNVLLFCLGVAVSSTASRVAATQDVLFLKVGDACVAHKYEFDDNVQEICGGGLVCQTAEGQHHGICVSTTDTTNIVASTTDTTNIVSNTIELRLNDVCVLPDYQTREIKELCAVGLYCQVYKGHHHGTCQTHYPSTPTDSSDSPQSTIILKLGDSCPEYVNQPSHEFVEVCGAGMSCQVTSSGARQCLGVNTYGNVATPTPTVPPTQTQMETPQVPRPSCDPNVPNSCEPDYECAERKTGWFCGKIHNAHVMEPYPDNLPPIATYVPSPDNLNPLPGTRTTTRNVIFYLTLGETCTTDTTHWKSGTVEICGKGLYCEEQYDGTSACVHVPASIDHEGAPETVMMGKENEYVTRPVKYLAEGYHCVAEHYQLDAKQFPRILRCEAGLECNLSGICQSIGAPVATPEVTPDVVDPLQRKVVNLQRGNYCVDEAHQGDVRVFPQIWRCGSGLTCTHGICEPDNRVDWVPTTPQEFSVVNNQTAQQGDASIPKYAEPAVVIYDLGEGDSCFLDSESTVFMNGRLHKCVIGLVCSEASHSCSQPTVSEPVVIIKNQQTDSNDEDDEDEIDL